MRIEDVEASPQALELANGARPARGRGRAARDGADRARRPPFIISETRHGFVCASAGVDHSNAPEPGTVVLLPLDPDGSARRSAPRARAHGREVAVIVSDSFGRPFRHGTTDVAIGVAGMEPLLDLRGTVDRVGYELRSSRVALADELAAAADLARGKHDQMPVVVVRGVRVTGDGEASELVMRAERDLFR